ncbi:ATP-binding cassette domain-containing protein [Nonomuraea harbinensis]|uniref:ATP-binding cassette domain-containing protein n=1 Tax=Nonomuraea harbinensis TaxID=1286938 RepID=A0ABW1BTR4_9ACTN|nr:ABC transporter ATP-binding protein [Nonomuraea harbinensis]
MSDHDGAGWPLIRRSLLRRRGSLAVLAAWSVVESVPAMASGVLVAKAVDEGFLRGDALTGLSWLAALLLVYAVGAVASRFTYPIVGAIVEPLRDDLLRGVVTGIVHGHGDVADGSTIARVTQQVESVRKAVAMLLNGMRRFLFTLAAAAFGLTALAPEIVWLTMPPVLVAGLLFAALLRRLVRRQRAAIEANERVAGEVTAALAGHRDIRAFGREEKTVASVTATLAAERAAHQRLARATAARSLITAAGGQLPLLCLLFGAPWLMSRGVTAGVLVGAATYVSMHLEPVMRMLTEVIGGSGLQLAVTVRRLAEADPARLPVTGQPEAFPEGTEVVVEDLEFAYGAGAEPVLRDLSFTVPENGHLAIVGPSGIGKSTLAALLAGLAVPGRGRVRVGGTAPDLVPSARRREHIVLVPQESYVFSGTVEENLRYLNADAGGPELSAAVRNVGAENLITRLGGLDAQVEPARLSAGEKQLIGLSRAYVSRAHVVILDEASCHLDPVAEARAELAFRSRPGTLIVIAHRASSALRAGRILLLDGTRASFGEHRHLVETSELYAELVGHSRRTAGSQR